MITFIIFIAVISVLIFVHEAGHFIFAKRAGMRVDEFGFGFPPRLWGIKKGETVYSVNWIPFGGFVKIYGENGADRNTPRSFGGGRFLAKMGVILAGVAMNFLFAALLLMAGNFWGLRIGLIDQTDINRATGKKVQIIQVVPDSPAQAAGLLPLDEIKGFKLADGTLRTTGTPKDIQDFVATYAGQPVTIVLYRDGQLIEKIMEARANPPAGQGRLGISMALTGLVSYPWYDAIWRGVYNAVILTFNTILNYWSLLKTLVVERHLIADISGPIGIATMTGQAARVGFTYLIQFVAMISINLAVLNAVPFPALDGGRALMLIIEKARGVPLKHRTENLINSVGFALLVTLMIVVTVKDISRFL